MKRAFWILVSMVSAPIFGQPSLDHLLKTYNTGSIPYLSAQELRMHQLNNSFVILDTREKAEFEVSHIANAQLIGFNSFSEKNPILKKLPLDTPIVVYCSLGIRSEKIGKKLKKLGFTHIKNLYGGIFEWKNEHYPIVDMEGRETDTIHTFTKRWANYLTNGIKVN
ncbi:MAG: rhodanese-like domain-containing protein [Flavobacteriaceae bacterium]